MPIYIFSYLDNLIKNEEDLIQLSQALKILHRGRKDAEFICFMERRGCGEHAKNTVLICKRQLGRCHSIVKVFLRGLRRISSVLF